jgi:hypothetical protein
MKLKISKTVHPPKKPSLIKWMQDFKIGVRIDQKMIVSDRASDMNQYYDWQKISA